MRHVAGTQVYAPRVSNLFFGRRGQAYAGASHNHLLPFGTTRCSPRPESVQSFAQSHDRRFSTSRPLARIASTDYNSR
jgi:hypothetical protein